LLIRQIWTQNKLRKTTYSMTFLEHKIPPMNHVPTNHEPQNIYLLWLILKHRQLLHWNSKFPNTVRSFFPLIHQFISHWQKAIIVISIFIYSRTKTELQSSTAHWSFPYLPDVPLSNLTLDFHGPPFLPLTTTAYRWHLSFKILDAS
jgi:hypothetical protein